MEPLKRRWKARSDPTDLRLEPLRNQVPITDERGFPTPAFIRQWAELVGSLEFTEKADRQQLTNQAQQIIRVQRALENRPDILYVTSAADLAPYLSGDAYVLPDKLVVPVNTIDLGDKALETSTGTVINGFASGAFMSSNASGVLRSTPSVASAVIVHNTVFIATAGPVLAVEGPIDQQLNLQFVGMFGPSAGTITGYQVSSLKSCFIDCADGVTYDGTTRKIYVDGTPFYSITGSAIRLAATLVCEVAHIESSFFKFDSPGVGIEAAAGYTVGFGLIVTSLKDGTLDILSGLDPSDLNWKMENNQGFRDSSVVGSFAQSGGVETTTIAAVNTITLANLTTSPSAINERFSHTDNRLEYTGVDPATVLLTASSSMSSPTNNQDIRMWLAQNGTVIANAKMQVTVRGTAARDQVAVSGAVRLETGDYLEIYVENLTSDADITMLDTQLTAVQSS